MPYVKEENNVPAKVMGHPGWINDEGNKVSDVILIQNNIFPIVDIPPDYDSERQTIIKNHISSWNKENDSYFITYTIEDLSLETMRSRMLSRLDAKYKSMFNTSINIMVTGGTFPFRTSDTSMSRADQASRDAEVRPTGWNKQWLTADNSWVSINTEDIETIRSSFADFVESVFINLESLTTEIIESTDPVTVDIESGWPENNG